MKVGDLVRANPSGLVSGCKPNKHGFGVILDIYYDDDNWKTQYFYVYWTSDGNEGDARAWWHTDELCVVSAG